MTESERETAYLLRNETMKRRLLDAMARGHSSRKQDATNIQGTKKIGSVIENAVVFNIRNWNADRTPMPANSLLDSVEALFALLGERRIEYVLVGGIALLQYVEGRNTEDLDLLMALAELERVPEIELSSQDANFARGTFQGLQIDILLTSNPLFKKVQRDHVAAHHFLDREIPLVTVEGLILLKLWLSSD